MAKKSREERIKEQLAQQRADQQIQQAIDHLLRQFRKEKVSDILPVIALRFPQLLPAATLRAKREGRNEGASDEESSASSARPIGHP